MNTKLTALLAALLILICIDQASAQSPKASVKTKANATTSKRKITPQEEYKKELKRDEYKPKEKTWLTFGPKYKDVRDPSYNQVFKNRSGFGVSFGGTGSLIRRRMN